MRSGHRTGFCGAPWSRTLPSLDVSEPQMGNQLVEVLHKTDSRTLWRVVLRRWRNSWWKCPRSCPSFLFSRRLRSKSLTFRFLVVEVNWEVFKVYTVDRVQQRLWSRSPSLPIQVEVFQIFSQSRVPQRLRESARALELIHAVFSSRWCRAS